MAKFIPKEKLSKRARKELARQQRELWPTSPVSRKIESKKLYSRKKNPHARFDDSGMGIFRLCTHSAGVKPFACKATMSGSL